MTDVEAPISPPHNNNHKRVSFGENPVKTFIYEKESEEPTPTALPKQPFTDPNAPVSRVRVTSEENDTPHPIAPPNQIEEQRRQVVSPPLPTHKMDEQENPFKPQEVLYHEVDPIVEQYLHKPFPPSQPGSTHGTPVKSNGGGVPEMSVTVTHDQDKTISVPSSPPAYLQNGLSKSDLIEDEKVKTDSTTPLMSDAERRESSPTKKASTPEHELPQANQVEIVHIKKKKCGCCSVQ